MSSSIFFILSVRLSPLDSLCFVRKVGCVNVILSSVHVQLTTSKTFTCIESSSPITLCAKHRNHHIEKGIHCCGNRETVGYTSKKCYSGLREMTQRDPKKDNICNIEWLEPKKASLRIWNVSFQWLLSYPICYIPFISVCSSIWWTRYRPFSNINPGLPISTSSGRWCLHILALLGSTSHIVMWRNGVVRRWKHWGVWLFQFSWWLF
jgi:hypothetical protein